MGPLVTRSHRDKVASYLDSGVAPGRDAGDRRPHARGHGRRAGRRERRRLLARPVPARPRDARTCPPTPTRSSARCSRWSASTAYAERGRPGQRQPLRQRRRDLHQRRRRRPALRLRGRDRHGRRQRADPGPDGVLLLRRLEGVACSATPTCTAPKAFTSTPAARS